jgi:hypothetical protein
MVPIADQQQQQELQQVEKMSVVFGKLLILIVYLSGAQR